jgi:hypothetical protein
MTPSRPATSQVLVEVGERRTGAQEDDRTPADGEVGDGPLRVAHLEDVRLGIVEPAGEHALRQEAVDAHALGVVAHGPLDAGEHDHLGLAREHPERRSRRRAGVVRQYHPTQHEHAEQYHRDPHVGGGP